MLESKRIALVVTLALIIPGTASGQFKRKPPEVAKREASQQQMLVMMTHAEHGLPTFVEFSPDGQLVYVGGPIGNVPSAPAAKQRMGVGARITDATVSIGGKITDGKVVRRAPNDATTIGVFRTSDGFHVKDFMCTSPSGQLMRSCLRADLSPDGTKLAVIDTSDRDLSVFQTETGQLLSSRNHWKKRVAYFADVSFLGDTPQLLTLARGEILLHRSPTGEILDSIDVSDRGQFRYMSGLDVSLDGKRFAHGSAVWDAETAELLSIDKQRRNLGSDLRLSPDASALIHFGTRYAYLLNGDQLGQYNGQSVGAADFSPTGDLVALSRGNQIELWQWPEQRLHATLTGHVATIGALAFSPDGRRIASAAEDCTTRIWDVSMWAGSDRNGRGRPAHD